MHAATSIHTWAALIPVAIALLVGVGIVVLIGIAIYHGKGKVLLAIAGAGALALLSIAWMSNSAPPPIAMAPPGTMAPSAPMAPMNTPVMRAPQFLPEELSPPKIDLDRPEETGLPFKRQESPGEFMQLVRTAIGALTDLERHTKDFADRASSQAQAIAAEKPAPPAAPQPPLPEWITSSAKPVGDVWRAVVNAGPYSTADEARAELSAAVLAKTQNYLRDEFGFEQPTDLALTGDDVVERLVTQQHVAEQELTFGAMFTAYAQLEIDSSTRAWLEHRVARQQQQVAVQQVGGLGAVVLGGLASMLGLLKIDESTQGRFRKRLLLGGPAAIIVVVAALVS